MSSGGVILAYHAVGECPAGEDRHNLFVTAEAFERQMEHLARRRKVVPLEAIVDGSGGGRRKKVAITFDDGYKNVLNVAAPILARYGFPATVFVPTGWIGRANEWDEPSGCDLRIMTAEELREVEAMGVAVESHGERHLDLSVADEADIRRDVEGSLRRLEEVLGRPARYLAYPYGRSSAVARGVVEEAGLEAAFSIERLSEGRYALERVQITPRDGERLFAIKTSGRYLAWRKSAFMTRVYPALKPALRGLLKRGGPNR